MDKNSAAGPDGFNGVFFQTFWDLISKDVYRDVFYFFSGAELPRGLTSTVISLIPKCERPKPGVIFGPLAYVTSLIRL
ncbi:hypothetical protein LIER_31273 [Lithospermum erythrorhizon]|uniref:Reverse transcriptase n=1 Tax=Lithospermum erythrorhizon TaxID=34254 RepID=A0AAV3RQF4_LITER